MGGHALNTLPLPPVQAAAESRLPTLQAKDWKEVQYLVLAPELCPGVFFLGETTKLVPVGEERVLRVRSDTVSRDAGCTVVLDLDGAPGEKVTVQYTSPSHPGSVQTATC